MNLYAFFGLSLVFLSISGQANAKLNEDVPAIPFMQQGAQSVSQSLVRIRGQLPQNVTLIPSRPIYAVVNLINQNSYTEYTSLDANRSFEILVPLRNGAGQYQIKILYGKEVSPGSFQELSLGNLMVTNVDPKNESYLLPTHTVESRASEITKLAAQIVQNARAKSDVEIARALHDWLALNVKYNINDLTDQWNRTSLVSLHSGTGVCFDYAILFAALARASGLRTKVVFGSALDQGKYAYHAWNEVWLGGAWKGMDVTWDTVQYKQGVLQVSHQYFGMDLSTFAQSHTKAADQAL